MCKLSSNADRERSHTMVANLSLVSSLRSRKRPHPSKSNDRFSMFVPAKSSKQTLNMWRIKYEGTTLNLVKLDKNAMFWESCQPSREYKHDLSNVTFILISVNSLTTFFFL